MVDYFCSEQKTYQYLNCKKFYHIRVNGLGYFKNSKRADLEVSLSTTHQICASLRAIFA